MSRIGFFRVVTVRDSFHGRLSDILSGINNNLSVYNTKQRINE